MDNSGPVFPASSSYVTHDGHNFRVSSDGLTKREMLAAAAMQGDWAAQSKSAGIFQGDMDADVFQRRSTMYCQAADALLAELAKEPQA